MHVHDAVEMAGRTDTMATGARSTQLHPHSPREDALLAVDLLEIDPGGSTPVAAHEEEHVLFVLSGSGELSGAVGGGSSISVRPNSVVHIGHREVHSLRNTGKEVLRVLMSTPLIIRSERALRLAGHGAFAGAESAAPAERPAEAPRTPKPTEPPPVVKEAPVPPKAAAVYPAATARGGQDGPAIAESPVAEPAEPAAPLPDISGLMKKGSEVAAAPRTERKRPQAPEPEAEPVGPVQEEPRQADEDAAADNVMELYVVFDGGSRGNPGQGYGSFMVQSPNRKPVIKRLEFGDNYTNNQAEYDSLIGALQYIIERLEATNRSPEQVELDIKGDSDLVVNQLLGAYKVKDAGLKARHAQAIELLDRFAAWMINWHERAESVRLLGH